MCFRCFAPALHCCNDLQCKIMVIVYFVGRRRKIAMRMKNVEIVKPLELMCDASSCDSMSLDSTENYHYLVKSRAPNQSSQVGVWHWVLKSLQFLLNSCSGAVFLFFCVSLASLAFNSGLLWRGSKPLNINRLFPHQPTTAVGGWYWCNFGTKAKDNRPWMI